MYLHDMWACISNTACDISGFPSVCITRARGSSVGDPAQSPAKGLDTSFRQYISRWPLRSAQLSDELALEAGNQPADWASSVCGAILISSTGM